MRTAVVITGGLSARADGGALSTVFVVERRDGTVVIDRQTGSSTMPVPTTAMAAMTGTPADGDAASDLAPGSDVAGQAPAIRVDVFGVFPEIVDQYCAQSLLGRARRVGTFELRCHDLRGYTTDVPRPTDDPPLGGGAGMLMKAEPILAAVEAVRPPRPLLLVGPGGRRLDQALAAELAVGGGFSLICGRYEGVDHRVREHVADGEISIGDYVLAGGELAACVIIDARSG